MTAHRDSFEKYVIEIIHKMPMQQFHYLDYFRQLREELQRISSHFSYAENRAHEIVHELEVRKGQD